MDSFKDPFTRGELTFKILERAKELKIKTHVENQLKEATKKADLANKLAKAGRQSMDGITNYEADSKNKN